MSRQKTKRKSPLIPVLIIICLGVMGFSGYKYTSTMLEYRRGTEEYDALRQYAQTGGTDALQSLDAIRAGKYKCPYEVDFKSLKAINEDIVGWLYMESLDLSYPIVHGKDNDYYLHRTFERNYNFAGSIFEDAENSPDFGDPHTIIYGHNMKNGSMFGTLSDLKSDPEKAEDPYFWILTPEKNYCYELFSLHQVTTDSDIYTLFFGTDQTFVEFAEKMAADSAVDLAPQTFTTDSKLVTLSTCTADGGDRFVAQGIRVGED